MRLIFAQFAARRRVLGRSPRHFDKCRRRQQLHLDSEAGPFLDRREGCRAEGTRGRHHEPVRLIESRCFDNFVHGGRRRILVGDELALHNPKFAVLDAKHVSALIATSANDAHVTKAICDKQARHVALESLPWAVQ